MSGIIEDDTRRIVAVPDFVTRCVSKAVSKLAGKKPSRIMAVIPIFYPYAPWKGTYDGDPQSR